MSRGPKHPPRQRKPSTSGCVASSTDEPAVTRKTKATRTKTPKQAPEPEAVEPRFDRDHTFYMLRDNMAKADAFLTSLVSLLEVRAAESMRVDGDVIGDEHDDRGDKYLRLRNHLVHLLEAAGLAVRVAIHHGNKLARHQRGGA